MEDKQVVSVTPRTTRRIFTKQFKRDLVRQAMLPDVSMAALAQANQINPNQLSRWCREHQRAEGTMEVATLVPVNVAPVVSECNPMPTPVEAIGEIEWRHGASRVVVRGHVDAQILRAIISQTLASARAV
ncbi:transposase [Robbsia sp. KACC 23696]|uniref:IS66-like element accessory protein TnpA n=1 Tax=Robbsia sp. KACC 23696 TaxID=3149231 RepID=UPI00325AFCB6